MSKSYFALVTVFTVLVLGSGAAVAQQTPMSAEHQQAQLNHDPDACSKVVEKAADDIGLRIQGLEGMSTRMLKTALLQTARNAATAGDDQKCWYWYDRTQNLSR
ncbi:MAG TPA: hypothetical protein VGB82_14580 [Alphaproteobacteria bacterium]